jgi:hypothetical protein
MGKTPVDEFLDHGGVMTSGGVTVMGRETYLLSIGYSADGKPLSVMARFGQGEWWRRKTGEWARIAEMSAGHRYNTAAMLMRNAARHAFTYTWQMTGEAAAHDGGDMAQDALDDLAAEAHHDAITDPRGWLRETTLYGALTAGLTIQGDGTEPWQKTGRDPVTGEPCEVPPPMVRVCEIPDCGCSGEAHA